MFERPGINGCPQGILVRGRSRENPALVILHGGPGGAYIGCARSWFQSLEEQWVVVNWDMRGAGLSYSRRVRPSTLTAEQVAGDLESVVDWVQLRYGVKRLFLLGHSFGTLVAPHVFRRVPDLFEGYIAVCPAPTDAQAEAESYAWTLARARRLGNSRAIRDLAGIGTPPYREMSGGLGVRAKWTDRLGGAVTGSTGADVAFRALRKGTEYTWGDLMFRFLPGVRFWMKHLGASFSRVPGESWYWDFPVPVTFIQGTDDWMTPLASSRRSYERLHAPRKRFIELEGLGHYPFAQAPERFAEVLAHDRA